MQKAKTIFLGGPIQHAVDRNGQFNPPLRDLILSLLQHLSEAGYTVLSAHVVEEFGCLPTPASVDLVRRDYDWMRQCDAYIAVFSHDESGKLIRSDGTHIELGWAATLGKPIVVVGINPKSNEVSHMVKGLAAIAEVTFLPVTDMSRIPMLLSAVLKKVAPLTGVLPAHVAVNSASSY